MGAGAPWRLLPTNFLLRPNVYQQTRRWMHAGCFEALVHNLLLLVRFRRSAYCVASNMQRSREAPHRSAEVWARPPYTGT